MNKDLCLLTLFVLACGGADSVSLVESPSEFPQSESSENYLWDSEELTAQLNALLAKDFPIAQSIVESYLVLMQQGDSNCPGDPYEINPDFSTGCMASTGIYYAGVAEYFSESNFDFVLESIRAETIEVPDLAPYSPEKATFLVGDFEIMRSNNTAFSAGGWVMDGRFERPGESILFGGVTGSWRDGEGFTDWHREGVSGLFLYQLDGDDAQQRLWMDGVLSIHDLHLRFENIVVQEECEQGYFGVLSVRDPGGSWHELRSEERCGCAQHQGGGRQPQSLCLDFSEVLQRYSEHRESL